MNPRPSRAGEMSEKIAKLSRQVYGINILAKFIDELYRLRLVSGFPALQGIRS